MSKVEELFKQSRTDRYRRVDEEIHPVIMAVGLDEKNRYSLFCVTETEPKAMLPMKIVDVFVGKREDGQYGITFSLKDQGEFQLFVRFCDDLVESSRGIKSADEAADFICARYMRWQKAFSKSRNGILSFEEVKGLIGELIVLEEIMIPKLGEKKAIESWCGVEMADQDFIFDNTWYEVKSTSTGSSSVRISSVEQLDCEKTGHLVVVHLDKTTQVDSERFTLNSLYSMIVDSLSSDVAKEDFKRKLEDFGYKENEAYNGYLFKMGEIFKYNVNSDFPCMRRKDLPSAVQDVMYSISLPSIASFME